MQEPKKQAGRLIKAALAVVAIGSGVAAQTAVAAPLAIEKAAAKKAQREKEAAAAAAQQEQQKSADAVKAAESLSFDPFASAPAPAAAAPAAAAESAASADAKRVAARDAVLARMASIHEGFLKLLGSARANRRSPNSPPPFTPRRPSDPPGPPPNVPPGPPQHAPPGRPPGVGN